MVYQVFYCSGLLLFHYRERTGLGAFVKKTPVLQTFEWVAKRAFRFLAEDALEKTR